MMEKQEYHKAVADMVQFFNDDVIKTSGDCRTPGWSRGNGCTTTSGDCSGQSWKD